MTATFDIETLPTNDQSIIDDIAATIKPPGSIKKAESIKAWMDENYEQALVDAISKTALDGMYGRIACIAWHHPHTDHMMSTDKYMTEHEAISSFYTWLRQHGEDDFCGHNIAGFDLPFLKHRSMILGIKPPSNILKAMNARPWDDCIKCTMLMWSSDKSKMVSMKKLCKVFGIPYDHDGFNGSMVAETWGTDPDKVIQYCRDDVARTVEIYKRLTFA